MDSDDPECAGLWESRERRIKVCRKMALHVKWQILAHEFVHSALDDAGVKLTPKQEEAVCDAVGSALTAAAEAFIEGRGR